MKCSRMSMSSICLMNSLTNVFPKIVYCSSDRYRQILEKALQFTDAEQLEALKAFVEASKYTII